MIQDYKTTDKYKQIILTRKGRKPTNKSIDFVKTSECCLCTSAELVNAELRKELENSALSLSAGVG